MLRGTVYTVRVGLPVGRAVLEAAVQTDAEFKAWTRAKYSAVVAADPSLSFEFGPIGEPWPPRC